MIHGWGSLWQGCDISRAATFFGCLSGDIIAASCAYSYWIIPVLVTCHVSLRFYFPLTAAAAAPADYYSRAFQVPTVCFVITDVLLTNLLRRKQYVDL